jgi:hypothetical protein
MRALMQTCVASAVAGALLAGGLGAARGADKAAPKGYTAVRPDQGTGEVLVGVVKDAKSAHDLLARAQKDLAGYFDDGPKLLGAVGAAGDVHAEATFAAKRGDQAVEGLIVVHVGGRDGLIGVAYDRPEAFAKTKGDLAALLAKNLPEAPAAPKVELKAQRLPDDSGVIKAPEGWTLNAVNAMVDAVGPKAEGHFGLWCPVTTPDGAAALNALGVPTTGLLIAKPSDPESTLREVAPQFVKSMGAEWKWKKLLDEMDAPGFPGTAKFLLYEADVTVGRKTTTYRALALIDVMPDTGGQFVFYSSWVTAPADVFDEQLPTLLAVWKSWKTDDKVFQARLRAAAESMNETARIIQDVNAERQRVMARAVDDWSEVIRGTSQVLDRKYDTIKEVDSYELDKALRRLNEREGYERWKVIPLKDLNNP